MLLEKRTRKTSEVDLALARKRLRDSHPVASREVIMSTKVRRSSGNVFRDVGFPPEQAENHRIRSELMIQVRRILEERKLTQAAGAKLFGVTQPRISDLIRGRIELFSIDGLVNMLAHAGVRVSLVVRGARRVA
jgi:predicted XRE-type DNA-binding protein